MLRRRMIEGMILVVLVSGLAVGVYYDKSDVTQFQQAENNLLDKSDGFDVQEELNYVPNEIIVKYKKTAADKIAGELSSGKKPEKIKITNSLDKLNKKYGVQNIEQVVKNFKADRQQIDNLLKKDKTLLTTKEKAFLRRLQRAPKGIKVLDLDRIYKIKLAPGQSEQQAIEEYRNNADVEYAQFNQIYKIQNTPNDTSYSIQWPLNNTGQSYPWDGRFTEPPGTPNSDIDAPEAWDITRGSRDITVAVIDTGVDYRHRDLEDNMWTDSSGHHGYDFVNNDDDPIDDHGHGTHCAGVIAAEGNNGCDITGINWNAKIMAVKFLSASGSGTTADAVKAIQYAVDNGADVLSNSWGGGGNDPALQTIINYAVSQGVIVVAAAGNNGKSDLYYPAADVNVISVAATDSDDKKASFSNYGNWVDIAAPGVDILSLRAAGTDMYKDGQHFYPYGDANATMYVCSGTSMACPHVAGACAILLSINPSLSPDDVNNVLRATADELADANVCSSGRLNLYNALSILVPSLGNVYFGEEYYSCSCTAGINLVDRDLSEQTSVDVDVITSGGDSETITLNQVTEGIGVFRGQVLIISGDPNIGNGVLEVSHGQTATVTYEDANDGNGNLAYSNDTMTIDCIAPTISDIIVDSNGSIVDIAFETDEYVKGYAIYGLDCSNTNQTSTRSYGEEHNVELEVSSPYTNYYYKIVAIDKAGNTTIVGDVNCCEFTTNGPGNIDVADHASIQQAILDSWDGGTVTVAPGTYYEQINFKGKAITLTSSDPDDWEIVKTTIIDADFVESVVRFENGEDANSVLTGFTVRNSRRSVIAGPRKFCGVSCLYASPTISNCIIEKNFMSGIGCFAGSSPIITGNIIKTNASGIFIFYASPTVTIKNNLISNNNGSAIRILTTSCNVFISNNTIVSNLGRGISDERDANTAVANCIFWDNSADLYNCSATYSRVSDCNDVNGVNNNICGDPHFVNVYNFKDRGGGTATTRVVANAGLYEVGDVIECLNDGVCRTVTDVNNDSNTITFANDPIDTNIVWGSAIYNWGPLAVDVNENYNIQAGLSPCINRGDPNSTIEIDETDIDGDNRILNGRIDIGADEVDSCLWVGRVFDLSDYNEPNLVATEAMLDIWVSLDRPDSWCCTAQKVGNAVSTGYSATRVDTQDLAAMMRAWLKDYDDPNYNPSADFDLSGSIDDTDKSMLQRHWFKQVSSCPD